MYTLGDTGSQITCISEEFEIKIRKEVKESLPVNNVVIKGAVKSQSIHVRK